MAAGAVVEPADCITSATRMVNANTKNIVATETATLLRGKIVDPVPRTAGALEVRFVTRVNVVPPIPAERNAVRTDAAAPVGTGRARSAWTDWNARRTNAKKVSA